MKFFLFILLALSLSCNTSKEEQQVKKDAEIVYDMYEPSEMAILMNEMYAYNLELKKKIIDGEIPKDFPLDFLKIHTAKLSDFKSRNETFESYSKVFIQAERSVFDSDSVNIEQRFNNAVGVCIACHQTECTGPIPRIKKLLIK